MIGRPVKQYTRSGHRVTPHPFQVTHDPNRHAPLGLFRVYVNGREIGRQLSFPSLDDCERMLNPPPEPVIPPLPDLTPAAKARRYREERAAGLLP